MQAHDSNPFQIRNVARVTVGVGAQSPVHGAFRASGTRPAVDGGFEAQPSAEPRSRGFSPFGFSQLLKPNGEKARERASWYSRRSTPAVKGGRNTATAESPVNRAERAVRSRNFILHFAFCILHFALLLGVNTPAFAQADEPPLVGRPKDFSGLVGQYSISATAAPTEVRVEQPIMLTVRITAFDPKSPPPERSRLYLFAEGFSNDFYLEEPEDTGNKKHAWEFTYRLRPKHADVKLLPSLKLVYYHPGRQKYQATYSEAIELKVLRPRKSVDVPLDAPAFMSTLPSDDEFLEGVHLPLVTYWQVVFAMFVIPPVLCLVWYACWRALSPQARRGLERRSSRLGTRIVNKLRRSGNDVQRTVEAFVDYLRKRTGFSIETPTPVELLSHLGHIGITRELREKCIEFIKRSDALRFAPHVVGSRGAAIAEPIETAIQLIHALEAEPCLRRS